MAQLPLFPGSFALVMATGIVSIAGHLLEMPGVARPLVAFKVVAYVVLVVLTGVRITRFLPLFLADLVDHARGFSTGQATHASSSSFAVGTSARFATPEARARRSARSGWISGATNVPWPRRTQMTARRKGIFRPKS